MKCTVYPLRSKGKKLPQEEVKANGRRGELEFGKRDDGAPVNIATFRGERGNVIGQLECATVSRITEKGLMVKGFEWTTNYPQVWWCVLNNDEGT
jgi:hypothetical protein